MTAPNESSPLSSVFSDLRRVTGPVQRTLLYYLAGTVWCLVEHVEGTDYPLVTGLQLRGEFWSDQLLVVASALVLLWFQTLPAGNT